MGDSLRFKNDGSGVAPHPSASTDGTDKFVEDPRLDKILSAVVLAVREEINTIRTNAALGLAERDVQYWKDLIAAKKGT